MSSKIEKVLIKMRRTKSPLLKGDFKRLFDEMTEAEILLLRNRVRNSDDNKIRDQLSMIEKSYKFPW